MESTSIFIESTSIFMDTYWLSVISDRFSPMFIKSSISHYSFRCSIDFPINFHRVVIDFLLEHFQKLWILSVGASWGRRLGTFREYHRNIPATSWQWPGSGSSRSDFLLIYALNLKSMIGASFNINIIDL